MNQKSKWYILKQPWTECEYIIQAIAEKRLDKIRKDKIAMRTLYFLADINIIEPISTSNQNNIKLLLTSEGEDFYKNKFIYNDENICKEILKNLLNEYEPVQIICQLLWGREKLTKETIYRLLLLKECIDHSEFKLGDISSFLMLLNKCSIISYNKKTGQVNVLINTNIDGIKDYKKMFLSPETPYTNIKHLRVILRKCHEYIYWMDKHFSDKGLEPLSEEADATKIKKIKILSGASNINKKLRKDFVRLKDELKNRGINIEFRIICNDDLLRKIHGRWLISKNICFNIPPINSIYQGQYDEIIGTESAPPFEEWWKQAEDLLTNWDKIIEVSRNKEVWKRTI